MSINLRQLILDGEVSITDVIDEVIQINGIIGVGKYSLADQISEYIRNHKGYIKESETK